MTLPTVPSFGGLSVALPTPFTPEGKVDLLGFRKLLKHVVSGGVDVLMVLATTGEAPVLTDAERDALTELTREEAQGCKVVVGSGCNETRQAVLYAKRAQELGADGALIVTPYYNKPTPKGLVAHYQAVAEAAPGLPIIAYNVPGRTGLNITPETMAKLWDNPQLVALKESTGNLAQIGELARQLPAGKQLLIGDDFAALPALALGYAGLVSVAANLVPRQIKALVDACLRGDFAQARKLHFQLLPLMDACFLETSPIPVKAGLSMLGICGDTLRLPLLPAEDDTRACLKAKLKALGAL
ncbi:MAG TPA: 4-hydroxy-tetrahydrodipicolinate synthase [Holophaga sp.]|nr:4-hydroxy-tetrahydrodipicolinate synthase [Holophaga sp.]